MMLGNVAMGIWSSVLMQQLHVWMDDDDGHLCVYQPHLQKNLWRLVLMHCWMDGNDFS